jgi:hypothetical protein
VANLLLQHGAHEVGHGPHALADLRLAAQAAAQAYQHVVLLVGLAIQALVFMSPLRIMGPACIAVCISSPVRSRKPVLMKATRLLAAAMQAFRLTDWCGALRP